MYFLNKVQYKSIYYEVLEINMEALINLANLEIQKFLQISYLSTRREN